MNLFNKKYITENCNQLTHIIDEKDFINFQYRGGTDSLTY